MITLTTNVAGGFTLDLDGDFTKPQAYLLQYGFNQSMQDAVAGTAKAVRDLAAKCRAGGEDFDAAAKRWEKVCGEVGADGSDFESDDDVEAVAKAAVSADAAARYEDIVAGAVGTRTNGPRRDELTKEMEGIAEKMIHASYTKSKTKLPTPAEMRKLVADMIASPAGVKIKAQAERNLAALRELMADD